jgi:hypothetical protein
MGLSDVDGTNKSQRDARKAKGRSEEVKRQEGVRSEGAAEEADDMPRDTEYFSGEDIDDEEAGRQTGGRQTGERREEVERQEGGRSEEAERQEGGRSERDLEKLLEILVLTAVFGAWLYAMARVFQEKEQWPTVIEGLYFSFVTACTIGKKLLIKVAITQTASTYSHILAVIFLAHLHVQIISNLLACPNHS